MASFGVAMRRRRRSKLARSPVDLENRIVADVLCIKCGSNLSGSSVNDSCAYCGHPNSDSVYGDYLIYSDPAEVQRLYEAARLVIYAAVVTGLLFAVATFVLIVQATTAVEAIQRAHEMLFTGVLLFPVIAATGIALLTRRHEVPYFEARYGNARCLIGGGVVACVVLGAVGVGAYWFPETVQSCLLVAWGTIPPAVFFRGLAQLMRRMPNVRLASYARAACIGVCVLGALTLLYRLLRPVAMKQTDLEGLLIALQVLTTWGWLCLGVASFRLLVLVRRNLQAVIK